MSASLILAIKSLNQLPPKQRCIICLITQSGYPGFGYPPTPPKESPGGVDPSTPSPMPGQSFLGYHNDRLLRVIFLLSIMITMMYCSKPSNTSKWLRGRRGDTQPTPSCELLSTLIMPLSLTPPSPPWWIRVTLRSLRQKMIHRASAAGHRTATITSEKVSRWGYKM